MTESNPQTGRKSPAVLVLAAWLFVGVPACWGVYQTIKTSMKLFQPPQTTAAATTNPSK